MSAVPPALDIDALNTIHDNTPFRNEEQAAWFTLFARLLSGEPLGPAPSVGYSQLTSQPDAYRARPVIVRGTVRRVERVEPAANDLGIDTLHRVIFELPGAAWPVTMYTLAAPDEHAPFESSAAGYFFKNLSYHHTEGLGLTPVVLAARLGEVVENEAPPADEEPTEPIDIPEVAPDEPLGRALLAELGIDLAAYDRAEDRRSLTFEEREPFYATLDALSRLPAAKLSRSAQRSLSWYAERFEDQPQVSQRDRLVAREVAKLAAEGRYSVAPLFGDGSKQRGELFTFEGVVRRAVRVVVDGERDPPLTHYYELELFTEDSQNLPLVFCVSQLPTGFPEGESIREPALLTGFFFKQWAYTPRGAQPGTRAFAPLLIGRGPIPLLSQQPSRPGWGVALLGVGLMTAIALWLWRAGMSDDAFEADTLKRMRERGRQPAGGAESASLE